MLSASRLTSGVGCSCSPRITPACQGPRSRRSLRLVASSSPAARVVLTREEGKNDKLRAALTHRGLECIELPLIEHSSGTDRARVPELLRTEQYEWVAVTSPEAASVFLEAWREAGSPKVRIAVVGGGTGEVLEQAGVKPDFVASKALGKTMGAELPKIEGGDRRVLYPSSAKASTDLQDSLTQSGFKVIRLHMYNTEGVKSVANPLLQQAQEADVITFGSPSAVKAWVHLVGPAVAAEKVYACIGSTSARASKSAGLQHVYHPEAPGIDGWVDSVLEALQQVHTRRQATAGVSL